MNSEQKARIMAELIKLNISQKQLAQEIGVSQGVVSDIISGKSRSKRVEIIISKYTGYTFPPNQRIPRTLAANN